MGHTDIIELQSQWTCSFILFLVYRISGNIQPSPHLPRMEHGVTSVGSLPPPVATADKSPQSVGPTYLVILVSSLPVHLHASLRLSSFLTLLTATAPVTYFPTSPPACCSQRDLSRAQLLSRYPVRRLYNPPPQRNNWMQILKMIWRRMGHYS